MSSRTSGSWICKSRLERGRWTKAKLLNAGTATRTGSRTREEEEEAGKEERQAAAAHARKAREKEVARSKHRQTQSGYITGHEVMRSEAAR